MKLQESELYWLAGLLEGEAYFHPKTDKVSVGIAIEMTDEDIIQRVCKLIGNTYCKVKKREIHHKQAYKTTIRGRRAFELMLIIQPIMGERRKQRIQECIDSYIPKKRGISDEIKLEINKRVNSGEKVKDIARDYPISYWRIYQLVR